MNTQQIKNKNVFDLKLIIAYGSENITLNKGEDHLILTEKETQFLIKSLINNIGIK